jgi:hypothetical protein
MVNKSIATLTQYLNVGDYFPVRLVRRLVNCHSTLLCRNVQSRVVTVTPPSSTAKAGDATLTLSTIVRANCHFKSAHCPSFTDMFYRKSVEPPRTTKLHILSRSMLCHTN